MWIKDLIEDILSPVYPGIDLQEVRSVGVNRLDNDGILPVYATSDSDRQALNELVEQEGRELNTEVQQLVFIRGDFGRFLQLFGTEPVLLDWDGNNFTIEFNVARWPDWFSIKIINEDITMPINTPIYYLNASGQPVAVGENSPMPSYQVPAPSGAAAETLSYNSSALEASRVVSEVPCKLVEISGYNNSNSQQWIQIHDAAALPEDGIAPIKPILVEPNDNFYWAPEKPYPLTNGLTLCNSSTLATKTIGSADCWFNVLYQEV